MMQEIHARVQLLYKQMTPEQIVAAQPELIEAFRLVLARHLDRDTYSPEQAAALQQDLEKVVNDLQVKYNLKPVKSIGLLAEDDKMVAQHEYTIRDPKAPARLQGALIIATLWQRKDKKLLFTFQNNVGDPTQLNGQERGYLQLFSDQLTDRIKAKLLAKDPERLVENMFNRIDVDGLTEREIKDVANGLRGG